MLFLVAYKSFLLLHHYRCTHTYKLLYYYLFMGIGLERIKRDLADSDAMVFCFRHQESLLNALGYGNVNSPLTDRGRSDAGNIKTLVDRIGVDGIITGTIPRHLQTLGEMRVPGGVPTIQDENLNAINGGYLFEEPDKGKVEERYGLGRFEADETGLYRAPGFAFDPEREQIFPFGIYSSAIVDKRLRELVFEEDDPLTSFDEIEQRVKAFQHNLREQINPGEQTTLACVGSCSSLSFIYEFAKYGTIGENIVRLPKAVLPSELELDNYRKYPRLYPQGHQEFSVLHFSPGEERMKLHLAGQPIKDYLEE